MSGQTVHTHGCFPCCNNLHHEGHPKALPLLHVHQGSSPINCIHTGLETPAPQTKKKQFLLGLTDPDELKDLAMASPCKSLSLYVCHDLPLFMHIQCMWGCDNLMHKGMAGLSAQA